MFDLGEVRPGSTIRIPFSTFDSNDPQASSAITGFVVGDIKIHKDGNTTERASTAGFTATTSFDTLVGINGVTIDLSDNTTAGFYAAGSEYWVTIADVTLDGATVRKTIGRFVIGYKDAILNTTIATLTSQTVFTLTAGPAEADALNNMWGIVHDVASNVQLSKIIVSDYSVTTKEVTLAVAPGFTVAVGDNISIMGLAPLQPTVPGNELGVASDGDISGDVDGNVNLASSQGAITFGAITIDVSGVTNNVTFSGSGSGDVFAFTRSGSGGLMDASYSAAFQAESGAASDKYDGPYGPGVYYDDAAANTNTTLYTDGTVDNPVSSLSAATTLATSLGTNRIYIISSSTLALTGQTINNYEFIGIGFVGSNTLNLGTAASPSILTACVVRHLYIYGQHDFSDRIEILNSAIDDAPAAEVTKLRCWARGCALVGNIELDTSDDIIFDACLSGVPGNGYPVVSATGAAGSVMFRHYSGGIGLQDLSASHKFSIEGVGQAVFESGCNVNATGAIRGNFSITDNTAGMSNVTYTANINTPSILTEVLNGLNTAIAATVAGSVWDILADLDAVLPVTPISTLTPAEVNAEMIDVFATDTHAEPGQGTPISTASYGYMIRYLYKGFINKKENDGTYNYFYNAAGTVVDSKQTTSEAAGTVTKGKHTGGP